MIAIPNMEMPKTCFSCSFNDGLFCSLIDDDSDALLSDNPVEEVSTRRLDACPLIEMDDTEWEWCHDCKEYDQEAHCCHRWTKVIRKTVEDVKESYKIVTCGECNRSGTDGENTFCMWLGALRKPTDFCSYGERRSE